MKRQAVVLALIALVVTLAGGQSSGTASAAGPAGNIYDICRADQWKWGGNPDPSGFVTITKTCSMPFHTRPYVSGRAVAWRSIVPEDPLGLIRNIPKPGDVMDSTDAEITVTLKLGPQIVAQCSKLGDGVATCYKLGNKLTPPARYTPMTCIMTARSSNADALLLDAACLSADLPF